MYAELPEQLVRMVDDKMNYDDLLFNYMVNIYYFRLVLMTGGSVLC